MPVTVDVQAQHPMLLRGIVRRLDDEFADHFTHETIEDYVGGSYTEMRARSRVLNHIPAFVERYAKQRLRAVAQHGGLVTGHPPVVLFVCARNDDASQMAAALFGHLARDRAVALSAGAEPGPAVLDDVITVMDEIGIPIAGQVPKPVTPDIEAAADVIVTIDAHDRVDVIEGKEYLAWRVLDGSSEGIDGARALRDELCRRVADLVREVVPPASVVPRQAFDRDLEHLHTSLAEMEQLTQDLLARAADPLDRMPEHPHEAAGPSVPVGVTATIDAADDAIDALCVEVERSVVDIIARRQPVAIDLRRLIASFQTALHLERIGDGAVDLAAALSEGGDRIEDGTRTNLASMRGLVSGMLTEAMAAFRSADAATAWRVASLAGAVDDLHRRAIEHLVALSGTHDIDTVMIIDRASRILERAADHAVDIAECALFLATGELRELNDADRPG